MFYIPVCQRSIDIHKHVVYFNVDFDFIKSSAVMWEKKKKLNKSERLNVFSCFHQMMTGKMVTCHTLFLIFVSSVVL